MNFNSFTVANDYNFGAQWPKGGGRRFFLPINKTVEGICLALAGKFLQKELWIIFVFKIILQKKIIKLRRQTGKSFCSQLTRVWRLSLGRTGGESVNSEGYSLIE